MQFIPGFENNYAIDKDGKVWSYLTSQWLKFQKRRYLYVRLRKYNFTKHYSIHRVMAITYIPNPENKSEINHIDGNKQNNNIENLEWITHKENMQHAYKMGLINRFKPSLNKAVQCVETKTIYPSLTIAAQQTGNNRTSISKCCRGIYKQVQGYKWSWV